jgi:hypothetical protein
VVETGFVSEWRIGVFMINYYLKRIILLTTLMLPFSVANSAIIDNGDYTTDSASGLDWLDVTQTINLSYDNVYSEVSIGGEYAGWRYATLNDLYTLASNYLGITVNDDVGDYYYLNDNTLVGLVGLLGNTLDAGFIIEHGYAYDEQPNFHQGHDLNFTQGWILETDNTSTLHMIEGRVMNNEAGSDYIGAQQGYYFPTSYLNAQRGSFLIRDSIAVPEPPTILLLFLGLFALIKTPPNKRG